MQAMPPLMHALSEAQDMLAGAGSDNEQPCVPDCWFWLTIAIFSCAVCRLSADRGRLLELPVLVAQDVQ